MVNIPGITPNSSTPTLNLKFHPNPSQISNPNSQIHSPHHHKQSYTQSLTTCYIYICIIIISQIYTYIHIQPNSTSTLPTCHTTNFTHIFISMYHKALCTIHLYNFYLQFTNNHFTPNTREIISNFDQLLIKINKIL